MYYFIVLFREKEIINRFNLQQNRDRKIIIILRVPVKAFQRHLGNYILFKISDPTNNKLT